jgi:beta-mannosidase
LFNPYEPGRVIKGWELTGGLGAEPFYTMGMWRGVRIEIVDHAHLERPYFVTRKISDEKAFIDFSLEIMRNSHSLENTLSIYNFDQTGREPWAHNLVRNPNHSFYEHPEILTVEIAFLRNGKTVYQKNVDVEMLKNRVWLEGELTVDRPDLWWPNGLGEQSLYEIRLRLVKDSKVVDRIAFDYGIRTIEQIRSAGPRLTDRWTKWQFVINGKPVFLRGINWMPLDVLLDLSEEKYAWAISAAQNAGIQIFRIWGAGLVETEEFYELCNEKGIMVWQDFQVSNIRSDDWPVDVLECQIMHNIYRLRNHPSLAVWCGGNENNAYSYNTQSMGVIERALAEFDPSRLFVRSSPDEGSVHWYQDMDPAWYKSWIKFVPFVAECGMHSITDPALLYNVVNPEEFKNLGDLYSDTFAESHPEFIHHFVEFNAGRVPRMLSRASHMADMSNPSLESLAEATQVAAGEFYQVMCEKIMANYPVTTGLLPWTYKRPWPVVSAIHMLDGFGQPSAPYYFLKRIYEPTHVMFDIERMFWAPGECMPLITKVIHHGDFSMEGQVKLIIYDETFKVLLQKQKKIRIQAGVSTNSVNLGKYIIPSDYVDRFMLVIAELSDYHGNLVSRGVYWPRSLSLMQQSDFKAKYLTEPTPWPMLEKGPWLKPAVQTVKTNLKTKLLSKKKMNGSFAKCTIEIQNSGEHPAFMVHLDLKGTASPFYASDDYFWLDPKEKKKIKVVIRYSAKEAAIQVSGWNTRTDIVKLISN